jgi:mannan endo-1,4-beta-mannosidase
MQKNFNIQIIILVTCFGILINSCQNNNDSDQIEIRNHYSVQGPEILQNGISVNFRGVNVLQTFGLVEYDIMNQWNVEILREFIGNLREQPVDGNAIQGSDGIWYHPLKTIVENNRASNKITILCPFGWVNTNGEQILFTGLNPRSQVFYEDYKSKMRELAFQFKDQPDVWIEVWNEPYNWNNENNYSHQLWLSDMRDMVNNLRMVEGFENIIIVPGNEQGQSENTILTKGNELLEDNYNIVFDIHAYEKWLLNSSREDIVSRIENIRANGYSVIFGEIGVENESGIMPVDHFLEAANLTSSTVLAWVWNKNSEDNNALLTDEGLPNASQQNNYWGTTFKQFMAN